MKARLRLAVAGTGMMARMRVRAFMETGRAQLVGVASRSEERARQFAQEWGCDFSTADYKALARCQPDAILVETPHHAQGEIVRWALAQDKHVLIGSCMAVTLREAGRIQRVARERNLVVESGFEARYKEVWKQARHMIQAGEIGEPCAVQAIACWGANADSWYYSQAESGGMPITHMTYAFLNPLTWIFGMPRSVKAHANAKGEQRPGMVNEVTCAAILEYGNGMPCNLLASYIKHAQAPDWKLYIHGTGGALELHPGEFGGGELIHYARSNKTRHIKFEHAPDPFRVQADAFIQAACGGRNLLQNLPAQGMEDVQIASAVARSAKTRRTVLLGAPGREE